MLTAYISEHHSKWDKYLHEKAFVILSVKHQVTNKINLTNFRLEVCVINLDSELLLNTFNANQTVTLQTLFVDNCEGLRESNERWYTLTRRNEKFKLNDFVWNRNFSGSDDTKTFTAKFADKFIRPFDMVKIISAWTYQLKDINNKSIGI